MTNDKSDRSNNGWSNWSNSCQQDWPKNDWQKKDDTTWNDWKNNWNDPKPEPTVEKKSDWPNQISRSYSDWSMRTDKKSYLFGALDWSTVLPSLPYFEKDFYIPHPDVEKRTDEAVSAILASNKIQIIPAEHVPVVIVQRGERPVQAEEELVYSQTWREQDELVHEGKDEWEKAEDGTWSEKDEWVKNDDGSWTRKLDSIEEVVEEVIDVVESADLKDNMEDIVEAADHTDIAVEAADPIEDTVEVADHTEVTVEATDPVEDVEAVVEEVAEEFVDPVNFSAKLAEVVYGAVQARAVPKPVTSLLEASFPEYITAKLFQMLGDLKPTAVQMLMWPVALSGRDCLAVAPTGTGKTLGYLLPAIVHISAQTPVSVSDNSPIVLVIAPTRELTAQIMEQAFMYGSAITELGAQALTPMALFGGVPKIDHRNQLCEKFPDFIVATPGRLMDFMKEGVICLRRVTYLVIDEVDRFLRDDKKSFNWDNHFADDIREIASQIRPDRQCVMCSATCDTSVMSLARDLCSQEPVYFQVAEETQERKFVVSSNVEQDFLDVGSNYHERLNYLLSHILPSTFTETLSRSEQKMIIFVNSKSLVDQLTDSLRNAGWPAIGISGDKLQKERQWIFSNFKSGANNILVATDVMGRGMDFENVRCVLNFDLPDEIEDYIHRVGRTGRIGKKILRGFALSFVTSRDWNIMKGLEQMLNDCNLPVPNLLKEKIEQVKQYEYKRF